MSKGGSQTTHSSTKTDMRNYQTTHQERFTDPGLKSQARGLINQAQDNYNDMKNLTGSMFQKYQNGGNLGDTSYFKQAWGQAQGIDQTNMRKLNAQSFNPNDNADWVGAQDAIDANARRGWGKTLNQVNQNMIASGMANGSGHQTAAYNAAAGLNSQLAADRANRWTQQYNQNIQNTMAANGQLENFYGTLSKIGLDYAKLSQQDLQTLLSAYNQQNDSLKALGNAIEMNSDPTQTTQGRQWGTSETDSTTEQKRGWGDMLQAGIGMFTPVKWFG